MLKERSTFLDLQSCWWKQQQQKVYSICIQKEQFLIFYTHSTTKVMLGWNSKHPIKKWRSKLLLTTQHMQNTGGRGVGRRNLKEKPVGRTLGGGGAYGEKTFKETSRQKAQQCAEHINPTHSRPLKKEDSAEGTLDLHPQYLDCCLPCDFMCTVIHPMTVCTVWQ